MLLALFKAGKFLSGHMSFLLPNMTFLLPNMTNYPKCHVTFFEANFSPLKDLKSSFSGTSTLQTCLKGSKKCHVTKIVRGGAAA